MVHIQLKSMGQSKAFIFIQKIMNFLLILSIATTASYFYLMMQQLKVLKDAKTRKRANPLQKMYTNAINSTLNNYLRSRPFPKSLFSFIEAIDHSNLFPSNSQRFINLLASRNFTCGDELIAAIKAELSSEPRVLTVTDHKFSS